MLGTIVNVCAILVGASLGLLFKKGISEKVSSTVMQGIGLAVLLIGLSMALQSKQILAVIISLALGGLTGQLLNIEGGLDRLGKWLEDKVGGETGQVAKAFVTSSLIYCVGAMSILGAIEDGLNNNHQVLFAKAALDGISSVVFTATLGIGVVFSVFPVLVYQGSITLLAGQVKGLLSPEAVVEMTATGGLLIVGIALNMLNITHIKVGNLLPAIFFAVPIALLLSKIIPA
ncbi:MAG: putative membrane protein YdfK [Pelotomaculum sp. PtaB.Bin104]|nr:MAG: putative membrane protein YdfK [Pelotomaculum sp. PtaB.Bin104]